jgi:hypothetical protein
MHLKGSSVFVLVALSTFIAFAGQFRMHIPQNTQSSILANVMCPLAVLNGGRFSNGYLRVTGFENRFFRISEIIPGIFSPLSA